MPKLIQNNNFETIRPQNNKNRKPYRPRTIHRRTMDKKTDIRDYQEIEEYKDAWTEYLMDRNLGYFMTITFNSDAHPNPDKDIKRVLACINGYIHKNRHKKRKGGQIAGFLVREENIEGKSHYHMLIKHQERLSLKTLGRALIYASNHCNCLCSLRDADLQKVISNNRVGNDKPSSIRPKHIKEILEYGHDHMSANKVHVNVLPIISETDKKNLVNYLMKKIYRNGYRNFYLFSDSPEDYYNFTTID